METQPDLASISLMRFALAAVTVAGLMGILALILKKLSAKGWGTIKTTGKRLKVIESLTIDARRRLVIISCDDKEYLLLLGTQDLVINKDPSAPDKRS